MTGLLEIVLREAKNWAHRIKGILIDVGLEDYFRMDTDRDLFNHIKCTLLNSYSEKGQP